MSSEPPSPRPPSPESSTVVDGQHLDDARSNSSSSSSTSSHDSDSSASIISHNNQEQGSVRANDDNGEDGVMVSKDSVGGGSSDEVVVSEDAGREEMFLDASEDLGADGRELSTAYTEPRDISDSEQQIQFRGIDTGMQNDYMVDEMERLRAVLDMTINQKDSIARECKDEIEMAANAIANLRDQMRGLMNSSSSTVLLGDDRYVVPEMEMEDSGRRETHLHEMIHECQMLIQTVSHSRKEEEEVIRQLQDDLSVKNQEISDLDRRVAEFTISRDVIDSYVSSANNLSMEYQLQKDQYVDDAANRMLTSLASVVYVEQIMDNSLSAKVAHLEKAMFALLENYKWFLYETDQLRLRLIEVRPDITEQNDYALVFATSGEELLDLKRKEVESIEKLNQLENEHTKLMEQLEKHKIDAETSNAELQKSRAESEQEKNRYLNTKEKLSLAVTKGKALVQERVSLKQKLTDKSAELEKCLAELQEKSTALQSADVSTASLQDMLSQKDMLLEEMEQLVLQSGLPDGLRSMRISDKIRWLVDDWNTLKDVSVKFDTLVDSLFSSYLPEKLPFSNPESQLGWIKESFDQVRTKANTLQDEITRIKQSAQDEIDKLSSSLSIALVDKDCLKVEVDCTTQKYLEAVEKEQHALLEKDKVLRMLQEASGVELGREKDTALVVQQCMETFTCMQAHLYVRDQGLVLCEQLLEEEMQEKVELIRVINDLKKASEEVIVLKGERDSLRKDLERSEDKSALIREKLSMAVKKGKGLVQEKENLKRLIDERGAEIDEMRIELQRKESIIENCRNEIAQLSTEVGCLGSLELDLAALRDQTAQTEKNLVESNELLQSLMELIDGIIIPLGSELEHSNPIDKVEWLGEYLNNCQAEKEVMKQEAETSANKLASVNSTVRTLEDALSVAENSISQLSEEKRNLEVTKTSLENQLRDAEESLQKATEAAAAIAILETELSQAKSSLLVLRNEKEDSESSREAAEKELSNLNEEISGLRTRLAENYVTVKSLEDSITQLENRVTVLTAEKNVAENELQKRKEEADSWDHRMQNEVEKINSLEFALQQAESKLSAISSEKNSVENEKFRALESSLSEAEISISVLRKEKEECESCRAVAEAEVANLRNLVKSLEDAAAQLSATEAAKTVVQKELQQLKEETVVKIESLEFALEQAESKLSAISSEKNSVESEKLTALESSLSEAEISISVLRKEKEECESCRAVAEAEVANLRNLVKSLEDAAAQLSATESAKTVVQKELQQLKEETIAKIESLEFALEQAESKLSAISSEKNSVESEKFTALESSLSEAEISISVLRKEKEECESRRAVAEAEVANLRNLVKSLEDAAAQLSATEAAKTVIQKELQQLKEETVAKIASLEFALEQAEINLSALSNEKKAAEKEVFTLSAKLNACTEDLAAMEDNLLMKEQEATTAVLWASQVKAILDKATESETVTYEREEQDSAYVKKLHDMINKLAVLSHENEELQSAKSELYELERVVGRVIQKLGGKVSRSRELVEALEKSVTELIMESNNSKTRIQELSAELLANQEAVDELLSKVKAGPSESIQERSIFEASSPPPASEISEIEEVSTVVANASISPVPSAAHVRTMRKGSSNEHISLDIASDVTDDDKGHVFKSLNASGLIPKQGKMVADRVDGIWVSAGRVLMSRPRARLSLIGYWLLMHIWLLGTIL